MSNKRKGEIYENLNTYSKKFKNMHYNINDYYHNKKKQFI